MLAQIGGNPSTEARDAWFAAHVPYIPLLIAAATTAISWIIVALAWRWRATLAYDKEMRGQYELAGLVTVFYGMWGRPPLGIAFGVIAWIIAFASARIPARRASAAAPTSRSAFTKPSLRAQGSFTVVEGVHLDVDPDPTLWLMGPDETRPPDVWVPAALQTVTKDLNLTEPAAIGTLGSILDVFARRNITAFTYRALRLRTLAEPIFVLHFGMFPISERRDDGSALLGLDDDLPLLDAPQRAILPRGDGTIVQRAVRHWIDSDNTVMAEARYFATQPELGVDVVALCSIPDAGILEEHLPEIDSFVLAMHASSAHKTSL